jgi:hypothetical protein
LKSPIDIIVEIVTLELCFSQIHEGIVTYK